jgi:thioredoxin:protein disulfide reductase
MKRSRADAARRIRSALAPAAAAVLAIHCSGGLGAEPKLLPPERAFAFSAQALDDRTVEARFAIANGYYLYREKLRFSVEPASLVTPPALPPGKIKDDAFFGKVETYRGELAVRLPLASAGPGQRISIQAESQGCADAGVCYPPQTQRVTVTLPLPGARPDAPVAATPPRKTWFN